jgi:hypothetical protein
MKIEERERERDSEERKCVVVLWRERVYLRLKGTGGQLKWRILTRKSKVFFEIKTPSKKKKKKKRKK